MTKTSRSWSVFDRAICKSGTVCPTGHCCRRPQRCAAPPFAQRSVESPTRLDIREREFDELDESLRTNTRTHVSQKAVAREEIGAAAPGTSSDRRAGRTPVTGLSCRLPLLAPFHRASVAQRFPYPPAQADEASECRRKRWFNRFRTKGHKLIYLTCPLPYLVRHMPES
ncbi:hypothetical protein GCM10018987_04720 [Streptomyces cremeus]